MGNSKKTQKIRSTFLLFALFSMVFSNITGCAGSGGTLPRGNDGTPMEIQFPSADYLSRIPEESAVRVHLLSGRIVEGFFLSYNPEDTSMLFRVEQVDAALPSEFNEEGRTYRIPQDKIAALKVLKNPDSSGKTGAIVAIALVVVAGFVYWVRSVGNGLH